MGVMLERSRIAEDLLETHGAAVRRACAAACGISVVLVGVLLAAAKGVVGATTVTIGLIMLPTMLRYGYDKRLAAGTVAATATLAQIIPPATVLVLLGDQLNNSYQAAQLAKGIVRAATSISVSDLFAGAIVPALHAGAAVSRCSSRSRSWPERRRRSPPDPAAPARRCAARSGRSTAHGGAGAADRRGARLDPDRHCARRRKRPRSARSVRSSAALARNREAALAGCCATGDGKTAQITGDDLPHPDRRHFVQPRVPRRSAATTWCTACALRSAGRRQRRGAGRDAGGVPARLRDGRLRDHLRRGADRGAGAARRCRASIRSGSAS